MSVTIARERGRHPFPFGPSGGRKPKQKAPVMLLDERAIVDCCVGVSFYAPELAEGEGDRNEGHRGVQSPGSPDALVPPLTKTSCTTCNGRASSTGTASRR